MDRMRTSELIIVAVLFLGMIVPPDIFAQDTVPSYTASPSGTKRAEPSPTVSTVPSDQTRVPGRVTCKLTVTKNRELFAPASITLQTTGAVGSKPVTTFSFDFGDGQTATGSGAQEHRYETAGTYTLQATPLVQSINPAPTCKMTITVMTAETTSVVTPSATPSTVITTQPETGVSMVYWLGLGGLLVIWLGANRWYQQHRA